MSGKTENIKLRINYHELTRDLCQEKSKWVKCPKCEDHMVFETNNEVKFLKCSCSYSIPVKKFYGYHGWESILAMWKEITGEEINAVRVRVTI